MAKSLYLVRGLPGSGKTTLGRTMTHGTGRTMAADDWMVNADGVYVFDPARLPYAHERCQNAVNEAMRGAVGVIAVCNTFTRRSEMEPYYDLARMYGYTVTEVTVESGLTDDQLAARSLHAVPVAAIARMRARWETHGKTS